MPFPSPAVRNSPRLHPRNSLSFIWSSERDSCGILRMARQRERGLKSFTPLVRVEEDRPGINKTSPHQSKAPSLEFEDISGLTSKLGDLRQSEAPSSILVVRGYGMFFPNLKTQVCPISPSLHLRSSRLCRSSFFQKLGTPGLSKNPCSGFLKSF